MNTSRVTLFASLTIAVGLMSCSLAMAQDKYPSRPVKIINPLPAGSSPDVRIRIIAEQLTKMRGQQVVVENRPGGGGLIGAQALLSATPDGYTLLAAVSSTFTILPGTEGQPADRCQSGSRSERLLVKLSKAPFTVLPYATGGTNDAIRDILGGRVHAVIEARGGLKGASDSGDLKALAIMSSERHQELPDLPTAAETVPGLTAVGWQALVAPKGTPEAIIQQLREDLRKALEDARLQTRLAQIGATPFRPMSTADVIRFIEADQKLWWPIVKGAAAK